MKHIGGIVISFLLLVCLFLICIGQKGEFQSVFANLSQTAEKYPLVIIDAGHGGNDPGKVGNHQVLEKDVNLSIALLVKELLEQNDVRVLLTRDGDYGLYKEEDTNKKAVDLRERVKLMNTSEAAFTVSIHQNSYPSQSCFGAQVFYYKNSDRGKALAEILQKSIAEEIKDDNRRKEKANSDYYLLKNSTCPTVIVECGFLSNDREEALLATNAYQRKMAWAIHLGILQGLNTFRDETGGFWNERTDYSDYKLLRKSFEYAAQI